MLHRGNVRINKAWGQKITYGLTTIDEQPIQQDILELFEMLFETFLARISSTSIGDDIHVETGPNLRAP
jgi:hypothetical protein